jgi:hypothetical protein
LEIICQFGRIKQKSFKSLLQIQFIDGLEKKDLKRENKKSKDYMIKAKDDFNVVLGGPGSRLNDYSFLFPDLRAKKRKDKIKKIFDGDRKEK